MVDYRREDEPLPQDVEEELDRRLEQLRQDMDTYHPNRSLELARAEFKRLRDEALAVGDSAEAERLETLWDAMRHQSHHFMQVVLGLFELARAVRDQRNTASREMRAVYRAAAGDVRAHPVTRAVAAQVLDQARNDAWDVFTEQFAARLEGTTHLPRATVTGVIEFLAGMSLNDSGIDSVIEALEAAKQVWQQEQA